MAFPDGPSPACRPVAAARRTLRPPVRCRPLYASLQGFCTPAGCFPGPGAAAPERARSAGGRAGGFKRALAPWVNAALGFRVGRHAGVEPHSGTALGHKPLGLVQSHQEVGLPPLEPSGAPQSPGAGRVGSWNNSPWGALKPGAWGSLQTL